MTNNVKTSASRERSLANLRPFQKGQSGNPAGRPKNVLTRALRQKLEDNPRHPQYIVTVHGLGYKFVA